MKGVLVEMDPETVMYWFLMVILYVLCVVLSVLFYHTNILITAGAALAYMIVLMGIAAATRSIEISILVGVLLAMGVFPNLPKQ